MTNQTITETGFYGTPEHQELVMKVMKSDLTVILRNGIAI